MAEKDVIMSVFRWTCLVYVTLSANLVECSFVV